MSFVRRMKRHSERNQEGFIVITRVIMTKKKPWKMYCCLSQHETGGEKIALKFKTHKQIEKKSRNSEKQQN